MLVLACFAFALSCVFVWVNASTHWVITEEGKVTAADDSLFNMMQPHDLVQFLRQEDRVEKTERAQVRLDNQKELINEREKADEPNVEQQLMKTDKDCLLAEKPLAQHNLFVSTLLPIEVFHFSLFDFIGQPSNSGSSMLNENDSMRPYCDTMDLDFSMNAFEHLKAVQNRIKLKVDPDPGLAPLVHRDWMTSDAFGDAVATALQKSPDSWLLYDLATFYWRIKGSAPQAIECVRRSLHFGPTKYRAIAFVNLGNILHQAGQSSDAATVFEAALSEDDSTAVIYFTAGYAFAAALELNKSIAAFEKALEIEATNTKAVTLIAALKCHLKIETALETQHQNLQQTLSQLQSYQVRLKNFHKFHEQMSKHLANPAAKQMMSLAYDYFLFGPLRGCTCEWTDDNGEQLLICEVEDSELYEQERNAKQEELNLPTELLLLRTYFPHHSDGPSELLKNAKSVEAEPSAPAQASPENEAGQEYVNFLKSRQGRASFSLPSSAPKYLPQASSTPGGSPPAGDGQPTPDTTRQKTNDRKSSEKSSGDKAEEEEKEESGVLDAECSTIPQTIAVEFLPSIIPGENKGFDTYALLNDHLRLNATVHHPLPWYPPFCTALVAHPADFQLPCCDHLLGVLRILRLGKQQVQPEPQLSQLFQSIMRTSEVTEAEIGQRIHTLLKYDIGPKWLALHLAAIYWRYVGQVREAVQCLRLALLEPDAKPFADLPLLQFSFLTYHIGGRLDDALILAKAALDVNPNEPNTHFLLGYYHIQKENFTGAMEHFRRVLRTEGDFPYAQQMFRSAECQFWARQTALKSSLNKLLKARRKEKSNGDADSDDDSPKFFCLREENGERCYLEERMIPGSSSSVATDDDLDGDDSCSVFVRAAQEMAKAAERAAESGDADCVKAPPATPAKKARKTIIKKSISKTSHKGKEKSDSIPNMVDIDKQADRSAERYFNSAEFGHDDDSDQSELSLLVENTEALLRRQHAEALATLAALHKHQHANLHQQQHAAHLKQHLARTGSAGSDDGDSEYTTTTTTTFTTEFPVTEEDLADGSAKRDLLLVKTKTGGVHLRLNNAKNGQQRPTLDVLSSPEAAEQTRRTAPEPPIKAFLPAGSADVPPDIALPEVLPASSPEMIKTGVGLLRSLPTQAECVVWKHKIRLDQPTSTWLSISAKGIDILNYLDLDDPIPDAYDAEPICKTESLGGALTLDHLNGFKFHDVLHQYRPEKGLKDAFETLTVPRQPAEVLARRIAYLLENASKPDSKAWIYATLAALYWRVKGNASMAIDCLRYSLHYAPSNMRDLPLVSLANVYHQSGMLHSALIAGGAALMVSPKFVVVHFTLANIYASMGELDRAAEFYFSTLALQQNFEPAKERLRTIYCLQGRLLPFSSPVVENQ